MREGFKRRREWGGLKSEESFQDGRRKGRVRVSLLRLLIKSGFEEISRGSQSLFFKVVGGAHLETTMIVRLLGPTLEGERREVLAIYYPKRHTCFLFFFFFLMGPILT